MGVRMRVVVVAVVQLVVFVVVGKLDKVEVNRARLTERPGSRYPVDEHIVMQPTSLNSQPASAHADRIAGASSALPRPRQPIRVMGTDHV